MAPRGLLMKRCVGPAVQIQVNLDVIKANIKATAGHLATFQFRQCYFPPEIFLLVPIGPGVLVVAFW